MVCHMGVRIQREAGAIVTQHTGHRFHISAGLQSQGRERMSQVMEAHPFVDTSGSQDFLMQASHRREIASPCRRPLVSIIYRIE